MTERLAFVTQWYPPEPAAIPAAIAQALQQQGMRPDVLTGIPNYPTGVVHPGYSASRPATETLEGLTVVRSPLYASHDSSAIKRLLNYTSWAASCAFLGQGWLRRADVALVYSSPATAALPAMVARTLWGTPYVLLIQDVWPDSVFASGFLNGPAARLMRSLINVFVRRAYARAAHIVVTSPGMRSLLIDRGVPSSKICVIYNWVPEAEAALVEQGDRSVLRSLAGLPDDACVFLYAGNHGKAQNLRPLVDAFASSEHGNSHLVLVGDGVERQEIAKRSHGSRRVHLLDPVSRQDASTLARSADFNVVSLADEPLFAVTMPSKVQSGLAAGLPMLVVARGDAACAVEDSGAGVAAAPGDVASIRDAVSRLERLSAEDREAMGSAGRRLYDSVMARHVGAPALAEVLRLAARPDHEPESSLQARLFNERKKQ